MKELQHQLELLLNDATLDEDKLISLNQQNPIYPFSKVGREMAYLLSIQKISFDDYIRLNEEYQSRNAYLFLFDMSPRTFGETWGESHIRSLFPEFIKETKKEILRSTANMISFSAKHVPR